MVATYRVSLLGAEESKEREFILHNKVSASGWHQLEVDPGIERLHRQLPDYAETALHPLPGIAKDLSFAHVFVKDESTRFGLPSFKIAGASWAIYKALCRHVNLPSDVPIDQLRDILHSHKQLRLVTCTEGNWGRATAKMAKLLGVRACVYVPGFMEEPTRQLIRQEGAEVVVLEDADYDESMAVAIQEAKKPDSLLVLDVAFDDFCEIPQWVSDGYSIIMTELDRQVAEVTGGQKPDIVTCSVGAGGWAHAVVSHYRSITRPTVLCAVESDAAPSLSESMHRGEMTPIRTGHTIMNGMNCGTISIIAWPILSKGVDWAVVVTDKESHACVKELQALGVNAGPCGAANLAALKKLCQECDIGERSDKIVVLMSTEGRREYEMRS